MASGKDLKRRIASVKSTQQITKAMKMVAAARLRRAQETIVRARPFSGSIKKTVQNLVRSEEIREVNALLTRREVRRVKVILITSDRGLCGGFNTNLIKRAEAMYRAEASKYDEFAFTCFGKKGYEALTLRNIPVAKYYQDFFKGISYAKVSVLADDLIDSFVNAEVDEIRILFAEFRSAISQIVTTTSLLPVSISDGENTVQTNGVTDFLYEPSRERVLEQLLPRYFKAKLYNAFLENFASEHGARMAAMDNATKNAGELIRKLTLEYNKVRQANITKELLEIVSGAEALK